VVSWCAVRLLEVPPTTAWIGTSTEVCPVASTAGAVVAKEHLGAEVVEIWVPVGIV